MVNEKDFIVDKKYIVKYTNRYSYNINAHSTTLYECKIKDGNLVLEEIRGLRILMVKELKDLKGIWDVIAN